MRCPFKKLAAIALVSVSSLAAAGGTPAMPLGGLLPRESKIPTLVLSLEANTRVVEPGETVVLTATAFNRGPDVSFSPVPATHRSLVGVILLSFSNEVTEFGSLKGQGAGRCRPASAYWREQYGARAVCGLSEILEGETAIVRVRIRVPAELAGKQLRAAVAVISRDSGRLPFRAAPRRISITVRNPRPELSFTGDWDIEFAYSTAPNSYGRFPGTWTLRQTGTDVCIAYSGSGGGTGSGTVSDPAGGGPVLDGSSNDVDFGTTHFTAKLAPGGDSFTGSWSRDNLKGKWKGTRAGSPSRAC